MGMKGEQGDKGEKVGNDGRIHLFLLVCTILAEKLLRVDFVHREALVLEFQDNGDRKEKMERG